MNDEQDRLRIRIEALPHIARDAARRLYWRAVDLDATQDLDELRVLVDELHAWRDRMAKAIADKHRSDEARDDDGVAVPVLPRFELAPVEECKPCGYQLPTDHVCKES